jgi:CRISPR-associated protein Csx3
MQPNLFPAILIAGSPNCGKSVLSFMLTQALRKQGVSHYLLRSAPDGEGDFAFQGDPNLVRGLRQGHKRRYTAAFIHRSLDIISERSLPLLVDIGGKPRGIQLDIPRACTHSILLYRTLEELHAWRKMLAPMNLLPIAELCSDLSAEEKIEQETPYLRGVIAGLERCPDKRRSGLAFAALLERVAGICAYSSAYLEAEHLRRAPFQPLVERSLAQQVGAPLRGENPWWDPASLQAVAECMPKNQPLALYGRGPVWLAAAIAALAWPAEIALYDVRYGWLAAPKVFFRGPGNVITTASPFGKDAAWLDVKLRETLVEPGSLTLPRPHTSAGLVLSGKLPRWAFAALARKFTREWDWLGVDDPANSRVVVVHSNAHSPHLGECLPRPETVGEEPLKKNCT